MESTPQTMVAAVHEGFGGPEVFMVKHRQLPELRAQDLLVRVKAAGLNRAEILWRQGRYGERPGFGDNDDIIGLEVAGTVAAMGSAVSGWKIGDRVMGLVGGGAYAQYARMDARLAMPIPAGMPDVEAGGIPEAMITAHQMLMFLGQMKSGDRVLIHGAGGGVGTTMIQMASAAGAGTIVTTSSAGKRQQLKQLGVDIAVDYASEDFVQVIHDQVTGGQVDVVVCNMGAGYLERNITSLGIFGRLVQLGLQGGPRETLPLDLLLRKCLTVTGSVMKSQTPEQKQAMTQRFVDRWMPALEQRTLLPRIEKVYPLAEVVAAHSHLENRQPFGKIILDCA